MLIASIIARLHLATHPRGRHRGEPYQLTTLGADGNWHTRTIVPKAR